MGAARPRPARARAWGAALAVAVLAGSVAAFAWLQAQRAGDAPRQFSDSGRASQQIDWSRPDALVESTRLARLPRDLLRVPLLRDTLTEDFVFYYERGNVDRLGLAGSVRRIVYEHDLQWRDELLDSLLDQPAELALWRSPDGRLGHFVLRLSRGAVARLLEPLSKVALDDTQLQNAGELRVRGWRVPLYRLRYLGQREILFASLDDQLLVLSSPGLALDAGGTLVEGAAQVLERLLDGGEGFTSAFALEQPVAGAAARQEQARHRISLAASALGMGYERFFPQLGALRFDFDGQAWGSRMAVDAQWGAGMLDPRTIWQTMPMGASACAALPVDGAAFDAVLRRFAQDGEGQEAGVLGRLLGPRPIHAGVCWYGQSRLYTPLFVADLGPMSEDERVALDAQLGALFTRYVGARERLAPQGRFAVTQQGGAHAEWHQWQREVGSSYGPYPAGQAGAPQQMAMRGFFRVSLARDGSRLLFSLDDQLVARARQALRGGFPSMHEPLAGAPVPLYLSASHLAELFEREALASLPVNVEPVLRNAAQAHLLPRLQAMGRYGSYSLRLPADWRGHAAQGPWRWLPLQWQAQVR